MLQKLSALFAKAYNPHVKAQALASLVSECRRRRLAPHRLMSLMQELLSKANVKLSAKTILRSLYQS